MSGDVMLRLQDKQPARPAEVQADIDAVRSQALFVLMPVVPKIRNVLGPKWMLLQVGTAGG